MDLYFQFHRWSVIIRGKLPKVLRENIKRTIERVKYLQFLLLHEITVSHRVCYTGISRNVHVRNNGKFRHSGGQQMERDLADLTKDLDDRFYCLKRESLQELAVILAEWKRQAHLFNNNKSRTVRTQVHGTQHRNITGKMCILTL